ncbi:MAG: hypothetical protein HOV81_30945 [Kofleriaceae bacterium]|nr:hypothetical protein [Kofleriaceae bacterium]
MDHGVSVSAVDLPRRMLVPQVGRRRHRRITGSAGLLLFVCLFLPAVKGCHETVYPMSMPLVIHPYVYGIVFAFGARTLTVRGIRHTIEALRVLAYLTLAFGVGLVALRPGTGVLELVAGSALLALIGRRGYSERRAALTAIAIGMLSLLWFGLLASTAVAMVGVYLSVVAAIGLLVGGLVWLAEI